MSDIVEAFQTAAEEAKRLTKRPDNDTLLRLYALYKQATVGDVTGRRPGFTDPVGRTKYDAWAKLSGMSSEAAMQDYVALVQKLK